jgi:hypothetical protein
MMTRWMITVAAMSFLAACSEKPQSAGGVKSDAAPYTGTGKAYAEKTFKPGDKAAWESALRARAQNGQNDYSRTN